MSRRTLLLISVLAVAVACEGEPGGPVPLQSESESESTVAVPTVVGSELPDALMHLRSSGLEVAVRMKCLREQPKTVVEQRPAAGSEVAPGTTVRLVAAVALCSVPVVWLDTVERARRKLEAKGFRVRVETRADDLFEPGTVIEYRPIGRARVGRVVTLVVAEAPQEASGSGGGVAPSPRPSRAGWRGGHHATWES